MPPQQFAPGLPAKTFSAEVHDQHQHVITLTGIAGTSKLSALRAVSMLDTDAVRNLDDADQWTIVLKSP